MSQTLQGRMAVKARQIKPGQAYATEVKAGQYLQITDVQGKQVADFVAFTHDRSEHLSTATTRSSGGSIMLQTGMKLLSNRRTPLFEIVEDTVGRHDMLCAACDPKRYADDFGLEGHANCREALAGALAEHGVSDDQVPDPINWFMNVAIRQRGELEIREPLSERNDYVLLLALTDTLVAISACPQDQTATNGSKPTDILVRVYR